MYLRQLIKLLKRDHDSEIKRRIMIGWNIFGATKDILKSQIFMFLERKV